METQTEPGNSTPVVVVEQEARSVTTPKGQDIWKADAQKALADARSFLVVDAETYVLAGELRNGLMAKSKAMLALLNPGCQEADALHKKLVKDRDEIVGPYDNGAKAYKAQLIAYDDKLEEERKEKQRQLEAQQREEEEKKRLAALKEAQDEADRQAAARKAEEDARAALAQTMIEAGATEAAEAILGEAVPEVDTSAVQQAMEDLKQPIQTTVVATVDKPKIAGYSKRRVYTGTVENRKAFFAAIVEGTIPDLAWTPNEKFLKQQLDSQKDAFDWPGVKVTWKDV